MPKIDNKTKKLGHRETLYYSQPNKQQEYHHNGSKDWEAAKESRAKGSWSFVARIKQASTPPMGSEQWF